MNTPRALLIPAVLALLTACGGGGGEEAPAPAVLWEATAQSSAVGPPPTPERWLISLAPAAPMTLSRPAFGEECVTGVWRQTVTRAGPLRLRIETFNFAVSSPLNIDQTADGPGVVEFPFRLCRPSDLPFASTRDLSLRLSLNQLASANLDGYAVEVRWQFVGNYR